MAKTAASKSQINLPISILSKIAGGQVPILPGESVKEYCAGLEATIIELEAKTPLQIYLAEKIFDCIWWIRRYESQKIQAIANRMWEHLKNKVTPVPNKSLFTDGLWDDPNLIAAIKLLDHTVGSLVAWAFKYEGEFIASLDSRIADRIKAMQGLQASYEALVNRKLIIKRLELQNEGLKKNLSAIDLQINTDGD